MDRLIRDIDGTLAAEKVTFMWSDVKSKMQRNDSSVTRTLYTDLMKFTGRRILSKLEEGEFSPEIWSSYCDFFAHAILSYGTSEMKRLLVVAERVLNSVLAYSTEPIPLLKEYLATAIRQEEQRSKEIQRYLSQDKSSTLPAPPVDQLPDLEPENGFTGAIPSYPMEFATRMLNEMPEHMTFAHSHCTLYLKLCNPLQIPACGFVGPGYACDTCHIRGLRAAYQAMLYDDGEEDGEEHDSATSSSSRSSSPTGSPFDGDATARPNPGPREAVRSDAQIARRTHHGFDMCIACAVYFYQIHRTHVTRSLRPPHPPFAQGRVAGVQLLSVRRIERCRSMDRTVLLQLSLTMDTFSGASTPVAPTTPSRPPSALSHRASVASQRSLSTQNSPSSQARLPLFRPCTPEKNWGMVAITCCIAPFGARPIAWVLPTRKRSPSLSTSRPVEMLDETLRLPARWRDNLTVTAKRYAVHQDPAAYAMLSMVEEEDLVALDANVAQDVRVAKEEASGKPTGASSKELGPRGSAAALHVDPSHGTPAHAHDPTDDTCSICLNSLGGSQPVVETNCHHWFHVDCMVDYAAMAEDICPLCRCEHALPDMSRQEALSINEYTMHLRLNPEQLHEEDITICIGALISRNNRFHNLTNVGALQCVTLRKGQLKAFATSEARKPTAKNS